VTKFWALVFPHQPRQLGDIVAGDPARLILAEQLGRGPIELFGVLHRNHLLKFGNRVKLILGVAR